MIGVELVENRKTREPAVEATNKIVQDAFRKGLLLLPCGDSVIRFAPPLVIDSEQVDIAVDIFSEVLASI
jgi:4-aminobutyrate aminotransferase